MMLVEKSRSQKIEIDGQGPIRVNDILRGLVISAPFKSNGLTIFIAGTLGQDNHKDGGCGLQFEHRSDRIDGGGGGGGGGRGRGGRGGGGAG